MLHVGRVAVEKNIVDFLTAKVPGTKVVVGDGPARRNLEKRFPQVTFVGMQRGADLHQWFREGDVFVFPSTSDTFGRVIIEALASGVPVAAKPVSGPKDIITAEGQGALSADLPEAIHLALDKGRADQCVARAAEFSIERTTDRFFSHLRPIKVGK